MKVYQEIWTERLKTIFFEDKEALEDLCKDIATDDTGHTDALTQELAKTILKLL